jgi:hypothetical protein
MLLLLSKSVNDILDHEINSCSDFKKLKIYNDHLKFIDQFCKEAPTDLKAELTDRFIYFRVWYLLENLNKIINNPNSKMILDYERNHHKYKILLGICKMKYTVSVTHNKARDIDYVTLSASFEPKLKTNYLRNIYRIIGRLDSYSGKNDPRIYTDAKNKYFQELLFKYDELKL